VDKYKTVKNHWTGCKYSCPPSCSH